MQKFIIERDLPGAGNLTAEQLRAIARKSCAVIQDLDHTVQWVESFVTADKIYCVHLAPHPEAIRRHAELGGFPANRITAVSTVISPTTAGT